MKVLIVFLSLFVAMMSGCASYSTFLLDEYMDINTNGDAYKNTVQTLANEVKTLIQRGDSLIVMYESSFVKNEITPEEITGSVELFIVDVENVEKNINQLNLNLRVYDNSTVRFLQIINRSKSRHLRRVQRNIYQNQIDINNAMIDLDPQLIHLSLAQDNLVELAVMMESQIKLREMGATLNQWNKENIEGSNHK